MLLRRTGYVGLENASFPNDIYAFLSIFIYHYNQPKQFLKIFPIAPNTILVLYIRSVNYRQ